MTSAPQRIFGIGLNKTGTLTLHAAVSTLGYRSLHWGGPDARAKVRRALSEGKPLLRYLDPQPEAVTDLEEVTYNFDLADRQYPGSRFILTVRDLDEWVDSRRRHVEKNRRAKAEGKYHGHFLEVDTERWVADYRRHTQRVRAYFADRPDDLLIFDVAGGDGWEPLCAFLALPVPDVPFPTENRYRPWGESAGDRWWPYGPGLSATGDRPPSAHSTE
jgi:hypothetical protein